MIVDVIGVPQLSLLDTRILCGELGIKVGYLRRLPPTFQSFRPRICSYFGPIRVVFIDDLSIYNDYVGSMFHKKQHHLILLNAAASALEELGVRIHANGHTLLTTEDLLTTLNKQPMDSIPALAKKTDLAQVIMQKINKESLLGKLQTAFYRIKQIEDRHRAQNLVYSYLSGGLRKPPILDLPFIDKLLVTDLSKRFVSAVVKAKSIGPDAAAEQFGIDRFEIAFVLKRAGYTV